MIVVVSGEGVTDMGRNDENYPKLIEGPMLKLIKFLLKKQYDFKFVNKSELKKRKGNNEITLKGKKNKNTDSFFLKSAYFFSEIVKENYKNDEVLVAVFFRDSDLSSDGSRNTWQWKYDSIKKGFERSQYKKGVPMLPKTASEVWLLSSILSSHKMDGKHLEEIRDREYLKKKLKDKIADDNVHDYQFDFSKISDEIHSYMQFKRDLGDYTQN